MFKDTPTEKYDNYYVKREDLAMEPPGPPFAKVRGTYKGLKALKEKGIKTVGYFETSVSMASWGISYFCNLLDIQPVFYRIEYKDGLHDNQEKQNYIWKKYGAISRGIKGNRQKVNEGGSAIRFEEEFPDGEFLPAGLKFIETIDEVVKQVKLVPEKALGGTVVICCGSGMMAAGVMTGLSELGISQDVIAVLIHYERIEYKAHNDILSFSNVDPFHHIKLKVINSGYKYTDQELCEVPFPCCPYYDRKVYKWMLDNMDDLKSPVLFWNIGSEYKI